MITIKINNTVYEGFLSAQIIVDIETLSSHFNFTSSLLEGGSFPITRGSSCEMIVDGVTVSNGFVDEIEVEYRSSHENVEHTIRISGRDRSQDIVDSRVDGNVAFITPISLENVIRNTLATINYTNYSITNEAGDIAPFQKDELIAAHIGESAFDFIDAYCSKRQVLLTNNGNGDLRITTGTGIESPGNLVNLIDGVENNIISARVVYDDSKRFNKYVLRSQPNKAALALTDSKVDPSQLGAIKGQSIDSGIRDSRVFVINCSNLTNNSDTTNRAQWERDIRRARAIKYEATVVGHRIVGTKQLWSPKILVNVTDDFCNIYEKLIVRKVTYEVNPEAGNVTRLDLVPRDTFKLMSEQKNIKSKGKKGKKGTYFTTSQINQVLFGTK